MGSTTSKETSPVPSEAPQIPSLTDLGDASLSPETSTGTPSSPIQEQLPPSPPSPPPSIQEKNTDRPLPHKEHHKTHPLLLRDFTIGFADGLTVPFAVTASLSMLGSSRLVILGGMAELFAGAVSMGLGAFLAGQGDARHYAIERAREMREVQEVPDEEREEIFEILGRYGVRRREARGVVRALGRNEELWVSFMMDFELQLQEPSASHYKEAAVMSAAYFVGGFLPLIPYFVLQNTWSALMVSIPETMIIMLLFGWFRAVVTGCSRLDCIRGGLETLWMGSLACLLTYLITFVFSMIPWKDD